MTTPLYTVEKQANSKQRCKAHRVAPRLDSGRGLPVQRT